MPNSRSDPFRRDEEGITPLIGTILILAVAITGMAVALFFGAPVIARLEDRASLRSMVAQFEEVRHQESTLTAEDASRTPGLFLPVGKVSLEPGTRFLVAVGRDDGRLTPGIAKCDFHVTDLADGDNLVTLVSTCKPPVLSVVTPDPPFPLPPVPDIVCGQTLVLGQLTSCIELRRVSDNSLNQATLIAGAVVTFQDPITLSDEWVFRLTSDITAPPVTTYAEAWLLNNDRLHWSQTSIGGSVDAWYEAGAVFAEQEGAQYLHKPPRVSEDAFGGAGPANVYYLRLPQLTAQPEATINGRGSHGLHLGWQDGTLRTSFDDVDVLRFDFTGDLAEAWCNSLLLRNDPAILLPTSRPYAEDPLYPCATGNLLLDRGVRSVAYCAAPPLCVSSFPVRFMEVDLVAAIHA